ncbi:dihydrofolate reductase [Lactobacillus terrae]|uniref:dihydrofolate reductase n=1 Tax=Lactobacillus terrae TaxID=2269374 RepID=UPI000C1B6018|nr:dihydrofolate reductase [Lactobacillus terrae]
MIGFVWAEDINHIIGNQGHLPWVLPDDMKRFKDLTTGNVILMGRKTYESFPNGSLPNRKNIILSRDSNYSADSEAIVVHSKEELFHHVNLDDKIMVIGGRGVFELFKGDVDYLYVTKIDHSFEGDVKMIPIDYSKFELVEKKEGIVDDKNHYQHTFETYKRIN